MSSIETRFFQLRAVTTVTGFEELAGLVDGVAHELCGFLGVSLEPWPRVTVRVGAPESCQVGDELWIEDRAASGALTASDWFELLFRHELAHLVVRRRWGLGPALLWEGLPIHFGDERVRARRTGHRYRDHCAALLASGSLLGLRRLIRASEYYALRSDFRVDLQAGAFVGFLLEHASVAAVRELFEAHRPPTPNRPWIAIDALCRRAFGADLGELEARWQDSLRSQPVGDALRQRYATMPTVGPPARRAHCDFCMHPLDEAGTACEGCGCPPVPIELR